MICDPLVRFCLDHLFLRERDALEPDLELAANVQKGLLSSSTLERYGWMSVPLRTRWSCQWRLL